MKKFIIRDLIAFPIAIISFFFLFLCIEIGGEWTAERFIDMFEGYNNKIKELN